MGRAEYKAEQKGDLSMKLSKSIRQWAVVSALLCMWSFPVYGEEQNVYVAGTYINGTDVSGQTVEGAKAILENPDSYCLEVIKKDGKKDTIRGSEIGYQARVTGDLGAVLTQQNTEGRVLGPAVKHQFEVAVSASYDQAALEARIASLPYVSGEGIVKTENARVSSYVSGQIFTIVKEVYGEDVDPEKTKNVILAAVAAGQGSVDLKAQGCYREVTVTSSDAGLKNLRDTMNRCRDMEITYVFGEEKEVLGGSEITSWLTGTSGDQIQVDAEKAGAYVTYLAEKYDTAGKARIFKTVAGNEVELTGPFGWKIDQAYETAALISMIQTGESQPREPQYVMAGADRNQDWGTTYAEVDLTNQHVYMIQEGNVVWDAPCVTGDVAKGYATPDGIYSLTYKEKDRILRGKKKADGSYEYESHVDYWMPFNGGIGLHDASWRGSFGGTIYLNGGSHGCINLPPQKAKILYDYVYKGMPVICYH